MGNAYTVDVGVQYLRNSIRQAKSKDSFQKKVLFLKWPQTLVVNRKRIAPFSALAEWVASLIEASRRARRGTTRSMQPEACEAWIVQNVPAPGVALADNCMEFSSLFSNALVQVPVLICFKTFRLA